MDEVERLPPPVLLEVLELPPFFCFLWSSLLPLLPLEALLLDDVASVFFFRELTDTPLPTRFVVDADDNAKEEGADELPISGSCSCSRSLLRFLLLADSVDGRRPPLVLVPPAPLALVG